MHKLSGVSPSHPDPTQHEEIAARVSAARGRPDAAVLEGLHALKHALRFGALVEFAATPDPGALSSLAARLAPDQAARIDSLAVAVPEDVFRGLARHAPRTGVIAVARRPLVDPVAALADDRRAPVVLLEEPRDLGNLGACVRVAAARGVAAVLTTGPADPWDPAALRGAAGLHYALPVARVEELPRSERPLICFDPVGEPLMPAVIPPRSVLAFGGERRGLSEELLERANSRVRIPMRSGVSSLNLATAVAAVVFSLPDISSPP